MNLLYIPLDWYRFSEGIFDDHIKALSKRFHTEIYTTQLNAVNFAPDFVLFHGSLSKKECIELKEETNCAWITFTGDARYFPMQHLIEAKEFTDLFLLPFTGETLKLHEKILETRCKFLWEGVQDWKFREPREMSEGDITFVGNHYNHLEGGEHREWLSKDESGVRYLGSPHQNITDQLVPSLYNSSYAVVCANNHHQIESHFTIRNIQAMAAGSCALMKVFPNIETFFTNIEDCIYYRDRYELIQAIEFIKNNPSIRNQIAKQGYEKAKETFTLDNWVEKILNSI